MKSPKITILLLFLLCFFTVELNAQSLSEEQTNQIDEIIKQEMLESKTPGAAIAIINQNKVIYEKGYGFGNINTKSEMTSSTIFQIASLTKIFTAITLLSELEKANIEINSPIGKIIEGLSPGLSSITFHQLLSHTSGIMDVASVKGNDSKKSIYDFFITHGDSLLYTSPGKVFSYSNTNYVLAGLIIEKISQKEYKTAVLDDLIKPLKLTNTTFDLYKVATKSFSAGHISNGTKPYLSSLNFLYAAGGLFSNMQDLEKLALCLMNSGQLNGEQIISPTIIEKMFGRQAENFSVDASYFGYLSYPNNAYNYGLFTFDYGNSNIVAGAGTLPQMSLFFMEPDKKFSLIVTNNNEGHYFINSIKKIFEIVLNEKDKETPSLSKNKKYWSEIIGEYTHPSIYNETYSTIFEENDKLFINLYNQVKLELEQIGDTEFRFSMPNARYPVEIGFYPDETGKIGYMRLIWRTLVKKNN